MLKSSPDFKSSDAPIREQAPTLVRLSGLVPTSKALSVVKVKLSNDPCQSSSFSLLNPSRTLTLKGSRAHVSYNDLVKPLGDWPPTIDQINL